MTLRTTGIGVMGVFLFAAAAAGAQSSAGHSSSPDMSWHEQLQLTVLSDEFDLSSSRYSPAHSIHTLDYDADDVEPQQPAVVPLPGAASSTLLMLVAAGITVFWQQYRESKSTVIADR